MFKTYFCLDRTNIEKKYRQREPQNIKTAIGGKKETQT